MVEMQRSGVPAAITLAQGILETESGNSELVKKSNNHFGIKCKAEWAGEKVYHDDDENGECFRKYDSAIQSYRDHSDFLRTRAHYASLFSNDPLDYEAWAYGLKKAGYATNPNYPKILIKTIEDNNLNEYTIQTLKNIPDYSVYRIEKKTSTIPIINKSIQKINSFINIDKVATQSYNGLKAVLVDSGVSLLAIATKFNIPLSTLLEYNDLISDGILEKKSWIYLQRKRNEGLQNTYQVKGSESIYDISQANAIQLSSLLAFNGLNENDTLVNGKVLSLKSSVIINEKNVKQLGDINIDTSKIHTVLPNESLRTISLKYKISIDDLMEWNHLKNNKIKVGQKLLISN
jgi:LysM repeat protein